MTRILLRQEHKPGSEPLDSYQTSLDQKPTFRDPECPPLQVLPVKVITEAYEQQGSKGSDLDCQLRTATERMADSIEGLDKLGDEFQSAMEKAKTNALSGQASREKHNNTKDIDDVDASSEKTLTPTASCDGDYYDKELEDLNIQEETFIDIIEAFASSTIDTIEEATEAAKEWGGSVFKAARHNLLKAKTEFIGSPDAVNGGGKPATGLLDRIKAAIQGIWNKLAGVFNHLKEQLISFAKGALEYVSDRWKTFKSTLKSIAEDIAAFFGGKG
ncbi:hypothetical protein TWF696_001869 [Orbilia brochopaga]|uniref:Uncharacterized protein n=1 Tax=Orbilia brochopaga TaxID=3140254 RepID=A0AAV9U605_9PEZI